ncbi:MAG: thiol reductase thioredoxin [Bacteroidales bacterium]|nr:thiol reductase thioredoxin [Bacteroidales bacterium]
MRNLIASALIIAAVGLAGCNSKSEVKSETEVGNDVILAGNDEAANNYVTVHLTKEDFLKKVMDYEKNTEKWVFEGDKPCLIDFYADWCAPCRMTAPILEELAKEYGDQINIYKIDTQTEQELAMIFGIQSIPTFLFCPMEGRPVMSSGIAQSVDQTKVMFKKQIDEILLGKEI